MEKTIEESVDYGWDIKKSLKYIDDHNDPHFIEWEVKLTFKCDDFIRVIAMYYDKLSDAKSPDTEWDMRLKLTNDVKTHYAKVN